MHFVCVGEHIKVFPFGLGEVDEMRMFTYMPGQSQMSGCMDTSQERDQLPAMENVIQQYFASDCPAFFRSGMPWWLARLPRCAAEPCLRLLYGIQLRNLPPREQLQCRVRRLTDVLREEHIDRIDILKVWTAMRVSVYTCVCV